MILPDSASSQRIEALVGELERATEAEIVVVVARRSGSYRDVPLLVGAGVALLVLLLVLHLPVTFHPLTLPVHVLLPALLAGWLAGRSDALLRAFTGAARRRTQVEEAARAAFVEEAVHGTRSRSGLLIYASEAEQRAAIVRDLGLDGRIPGAAWSGLTLELRDLAGLEALLRAVGAILAERLPARGENPNEIPDAPRVRR